MVQATVSFTSGICVVQAFSISILKALPAGSARNVTVQVRSWSALEISHLPITALNAELAAGDSPAGACWACTCEPKSATKRATRSARAYRMAVGYQRRLTAANPLCRVGRLARGAG